MNAQLRYALAASMVSLFALSLALDAQAGGNVRGGSRSSVHANNNASRNNTANRNTSNNNVNRNTSNNNVNRNTNVNNTNVNRNTNVNVNVDSHGGGYYGGGCCYHDNPVAALAVTTAAVAVTAAAIGSMTQSLPPSGCQTQIVNGFAYQQCGSTWYQPQMSGSTTTYVVVNPPH